MTKYRIYQMKIDETRMGIYMASYFDKEYRMFESKDYDLVYDSILPDNVKSTNEEEDVQNLETLFCIFNTEYPVDYKGRSMSVSDIIELYDDEQSRYYCCRSQGWSKCFLNKN